MNQDGMEHWVWHGFGFRIPRDWEMLSFSRDPEVGRCGFADRYSFRFELNWRRVGGPPDFDRMLSDYAARLVSENARKPARCDLGPWKGLSAEVNQVFTTRYGRYFANRECLVELVFLWPGKHDKSIEQDVLADFESLDARPDGMQRWRAFGMDIRASAELPLNDVAVRPADAQLVFGEPTRGRCETFRRLGLVQDWLHGPLRDWLARNTPAGMQIERQFTDLTRGHDIHLVRAVRNLAPLRRAMGMRRYYDCAAWVCPRDKRLYNASLSYVARAARDRTDLAGKILSCCREIE